MTPEQVDKLITFGKMALEQGWYDQAREYFKQALDLDASNREAMKGLARVNEILSRKVTVKPIQVKPAKPPRKVTTANKVTYGLAAIVVLAVVAILAWIVYSMFIEPPRKAAVAPTAAAIHRETPKPTPTLKPLPTPTQKRPVPTPVVLAETIFGEAVQRQMYSDYVEAWRSNVGGKDVYEEIAQRWGTTADVVKAIAVEGFKKSWVTPTPVPPTLTPTPVPPTPTPEMSYEEATYLLAVADAPDCFANAEVELKLLIQEMGRKPYVRGDRSWQKDVATAKASFFECFFRLKELNPPPRLADIHADLVECGKFGLLAHDDYMFAIEELVPKAIEYGNEQMEWMADCFKQAFDEIDGILGL